MNTTHNVIPQDHIHVDTSNIYYDAVFRPIEGLEVMLIDDQSNHSI